jgi:hypothetical protein
MALIKPKAPTETVCGEAKVSMAMFSEQMDEGKVFIAHCVMQLKRDLFVQVASREGWRQWRISAAKTGSDSGVAYKMGAIPDDAVWTPSDRRLPLDLREYTFKV